MEASVCSNEIGYRLKKALSSPLRDLILNQDSYGQIFSLLLSKECIHAIPCLTFLVGVLLLVWRNKKMFEISGLAPQVKPKYFLPAQVLLTWMFINMSLTLWLLLQKVLYCFVWYSLSQKSKPWRNQVAGLWWYRDEPETFESTISTNYAKHISWFLAQTIAGGFCYTMNYNLFKTKIQLFEVNENEDSPSNHVHRDLFKVQDVMKEEEPPEYFQQTVRCRKGRPNKPYSQPTCSGDICINTFNNHQHSDSETT